MLEPLSYLPLDPGVSSPGSPIQTIIERLLAGDLEQGFREFFSAFSVAPDKVAMCVTLGERLLELRQFELAREFFRRAQNLERDNPEHARHLGQCFAGEGNQQEARDWLLRATDLEQRRARPAGPAPRAPTLREVLLGVNELGTATRETFAEVIQRIEALERRHEELAQAERWRAARDAAHGARCLKVVFLAESASAWKVWDNVYRAFARDPRFDVRVVSAPSAPSREAREELVTLLAQRGVAHVDHEYYQLELERPDVTFYMSPDDRARSAAWRLDAVQRVCPRIVYAPEGLQLERPGLDPCSGYDLPILRQAWRVLGRSEGQKAGFGRHCARGNDHVVVSGHPKLDVIRAFRREDVAPEIAAFARQRKIVLYHPQPGPGGQRSSFSAYKDALFSCIESRRDCVLILRPHPRLFQALIDSGETTPAGLLELQRALAASDSILLDLSGDDVQALHVADAIIGDASSLLLEFALLGKPVAYLEAPNGAALDPDALPLAAYFERPRTPAELAGFVERVATGRDPLHAPPLEAVRAVVHQPEGSVADVIKEHVFEAIRSGN
jgi:tetratricopeptide (TPR) repeat protein